MAEAVAAETVDLDVPIDGDEFSDDDEEAPVYIASETQFDLQTHLRRMARHDILKWYSLLCCQFSNQCFSNFSIFYNF